MLSDRQIRQDEAPVRSDQKPVQSDSPVESSMLMDHWRLLRTHLFWAYDRPLLRAQRRWEYDSYPAAAWLIRKGTVTLDFEGESEHYGEGTWVFPKFAPGMQEFSSDAHVLSVRFALQWPNGEHLFDRSKSLAVPEGELTAFTRASVDLVQFITARLPSRTGAQSFLHGTLEEYLHLQPVFSAWIGAYYTLFRQSGRSLITLNHLHEKTHQAIHYLDHRPLSLAFQEAELASEVGLSSSHLHKIFLKEIRMTPAAYWNNRKLTATKSKLAGSSQSIKAIAYEMGFSSPENFTHWFRSQTQQSPSQFRAAHLHE